MATEERSAGAPRPGDARSSGPRPRARAGDVGWFAMAAVLVAVTAVQFVALFVALARLEAPLSGGRLFVGFLITVVWLLTVAWFAMGAWRRTVWGCPFEHLASAPAARRCERHGAVIATEPPPG